MTDFYRNQLAAEAFGHVPMFGDDAPRRDPGLIQAHFSLATMIRNMDVGYGPPLEWQCVVHAPGAVAEQVAA